MRRAAKVDRNQAEIVKAFRQIGATVQLLHQVGSGCPDALVGFRGKNFLCEIKDGSKPPSERKLTADQKRWHETWGGTVFVVGSIEEAVHAVSLEGCGVVRPSIGVSGLKR